MWIAVKIWSKLINWIYDFSKKPPFQGSINDCSKSLIKYIDCFIIENSEVLFKYDSLLGV